MSAQRQAAGEGFPGPIRISSNGRGFVDTQGKPFFWLGDTAWPLFAQYSRDEAESYLRNRAGHGFTVIQCVLTWGGGTGFEGTAPGANYTGHLPWPDGPAAPNPLYFENVDHLVAFAEEQGLVLAMLPTWGYYVSQVKTLNPENAMTYGRWLGARYKDAANVIWVNGGDRVPTGNEQTWRALAHGLREGDNGAHLITFHPCGWTSSAQFFHQDDWLDFNMIQTWTEWSKVYPAVASDASLWPRKPVVLAEGAYENGPEYPQGPITPLLVRRQAWWAFMAGGFFTYGQDRMWRMGAGWAATFDTPGAGHMTQLKSILGSRRWWEMVPDQGMFAAGVSSEKTLNTALRSMDSTCVMIYMSSQCNVLIHLHKISTRNVKATLINPQTGEQKDAGVYATGNLVALFPKSNTQWFSTPPFWEDALLMLDGIE